MRRLHANRIFRPGRSAPARRRGWPL